MKRITSPTGKRLSGRWTLSANTILEKKDAKKRYIEWKKVHHAPHNRFKKRKAWISRRGKSVALLMNLQGVDHGQLVGRTNLGLVDTGVVGRT